MKRHFSRRHFLRASCLAAAGMSVPLASLGGAEPFQKFQRTGPARMRLSLAAYSFRDYFVNSTHTRNVSTGQQRRIDLFQFIDYCAERRCDGAELTSYYFPRDIQAEFLLKVKRHAFLQGVSISGTAVGNTFTLAKGQERDTQIASVKKWIEHAALLGAPHIRVFAGSADNSQKVEAKSLCVAALEECCEYAATRGVMLGLENHGGIVSESADLLEIVRAVRSPWLGINLDTGNFHTEDPYRDIAACAPYAVNVQFKSEMAARGQKSTKADTARIFKILRDANYRGFVALEYESAEDPWQAVPRILSEMQSAMSTGRW